MQFEDSFINQRVAGPVVRVQRKDLIDFVIAQSKTDRPEVWVLLDKPEFVSLRSEAITKGIRFNGYNFDDRNVAWILFKCYDGYFSVSYMPYDDQKTDDYFNDLNYQCGYDIEEIRSRWIFANLGETPIDVGELI